MPQISSSDVGMIMAAVINLVTLLGSVVVFADMGGSWLFWLLVLYLGPAAATAIFLAVFRSAMGVTPHKDDVRLTTLALAWPAITGIGLMLLKDTLFE